jgi:hypothetical protein
MTSPVTNTDLKRYLRMPISAEPDLDAVLDALLAGAVERVEVILGQPIEAVTVTESIKLAIKYLAAFLFQRPDADADAMSSALVSVGLLLSQHREYSFPADEA